jgi:hypothetical protein
MTDIAALPDIEASLFHIHHRIAIHSGPVDLQSGA